MPSRANSVKHAPDCCLASAPRAESAKLPSMRSLWTVAFVVAGLWPRLSLGFGCPDPTAGLGFECTEVTDSDPLVSNAWTQRCLRFWINDDSDFLLTRENRAVVLASFERWSNQACTDLQFQFEGLTSQGAEFDQDSGNNQNVVMFAETADQAAGLFDEGDNLLAITLVRFSRTTGEIFDADIVINGTLVVDQMQAELEAEFDIVEDSTACLQRPVLVFDLENTLVHEVGHLLGFAHTNNLSATMYCGAEVCEVSKRQLSSIDIDGVCSVYPAGMPAQTCAPPSGGYGSSDFLNRLRNQCDPRARDEGCTSIRVQRRPAWRSVLLVVALTVVLIMVRLRIRRRR